MEKISRKNFFAQSARLGGCCAAALLSNSLPTLASESSEKKADSVFTPCAERVKQGQDVLRRIMAQLDQKVDQATRHDIMETCGRLCYTNGYGASAKKPTPAEAAKFLEGMRKSYRVEEAGDTTVVHFSYTQNPRGLKVADGYCLCPILEDAPPNVSPTYCHCSVGYVKTMFEQRLGKPVSVELKNAVLWGGKSCDFTIRFKTA